jgi:farnesol kinase
MPMSSLLEDTSADSVSAPDSAPPATSQNEIYRKLMHILPAVLPFVLVFLPHDDPPDWIAMSIVTAIIIVLTGIYLGLRSRVSRPQEADFFSSALSYPATVLGTLLIFPSHAEFAMVVVILIGLGDGSAYICGTRFGRKPLPWNPEKSWAGTLGFVLFSAPVATLAFWLEAKNPEVPFLLAAACCGIAAIASALAESWPTKLTDNLRVGLTAAVTVSGSYFLLSRFWI